MCEINSSIKNIYKSFINQHYLQINATLYTKSNQFINQHYLQIIYQSTLFTKSKVFTKPIQIIQVSMSFTLNVIRDIDKHHDAASGVYQLTWFVS